MKKDWPFRPAPPEHVPAVRPAMLTDVLLTTGAGEIAVGTTTCPTPPRAVE